MAAQYDDRLLTVEPFAEPQHEFVRPAPHDDDIDAAIEFFEAVGHLLTCIQEIHCVVRAGKKAIHADPAEDRQLHGAPPDLNSRRYFCASESLW